ncbi:MAG: effector-associated domain EAD1-containing protein [Minicystis sp.]
MPPIDDPPPVPPPPPLTALRGPQLDALRKALLSAFPNISKLGAMVRTKLDKNPEEISLGADLEVRVFELITWAESQGRLVELIRGARQKNPGNPMLRRIAIELGVETEGDIPEEGETWPVWTFLTSRRLAILIGLLGALGVAMAVIFLGVPFCREWLRRREMLSFVEKIEAHWLTNHPLSDAESSLDLRKLRATFFSLHQKDSLVPPLSLPEQCKLLQAISKSFWMDVKDSSKSDAEKAELYQHAVTVSEAACTGTTNAFSGDELCARMNACEWMGILFIQGVSRGLDTRSPAEIKTRANTLYDRWTTSMGAAYQSCQLASLPAGGEKANVSASLFSKAAILSYYAAAPPSPGGPWDRELIEKTSERALRVYGEGKVVTPDLEVALIELSRISALTGATEPPRFEEQVDSICTCRSITATTFPGIDDATKKMCGIVGPPPDASSFHYRSACVRRKAERRWIKRKALGNQYCTARLGPNDAALCKQIGALKAENEIDRRPTFVTEPHDPTLGMHLALCKLLTDAPVKLASPLRSTLLAASLRALPPASSPDLESFVADLDEWLVEANNACLPGK